jgi:hypothetical protein
VPFDDIRANDNDTSDRRAFPRHKVLLTGKLAFADANLTADCAIRNLSETGAMIDLPAILLPNEPFLIVIKHAILHETRTAWRCESRAGLWFQASWRLNAGAAPERVGPYRQLWLQLLPH